MTIGVDPPPLAAGRLEPGHFFDDRPPFQARGWGVIVGMTIGIARPRRAAPRLESGIFDNRAPFRQEVGVSS